MRVLEGLALALSGATLLTSVTSQAADLPSRKSAPADYVRVCDAYGTGYYWIPGTDTCLKVGGRVRYDMSYVPAKNAVVHRSTVGNGLAAGTFMSANGVDTIGDNLRASVTMDARTQTAWGTLQTAMSIRVSGLSGIMNAPPGYPNGFFASGNGPGSGIEFAYIRFAGFTAGIAFMNSLFLRDTPLLSSSAGDGHPPFVPQLTYTATFGSGFSATFGIEDRTRPISMTTGTLGANPFTATAATAGPNATRLPALVGSFQVDQSWGAAKIAGVVVRNSATFGNLPLAVVGNNGKQISATGWAVTAGLRVNLPMLAAGDKFEIAAGYSVGAQEYVWSSGANGDWFDVAAFMGGFLRADRNFTIYCVNAACSIGGGEQLKVFHAMAVFTHYWTPTLRTHLYAAYSHLTPGRVGQATAWQEGGLSKASIWQGWAQLVWSPVQNFNIISEVTYARLNQSLPLSVPVGLGTLAAISPNNWGARMRIVRSF
ncbi:MAG: porin [Rhizobiales bacterium]|nr:porin [Hyphomicrobiales bacterium]